MLEVVKEAVREHGASDLSSRRLLPTLPALQTTTVNTVNQLTNLTQVNATVVSGSVNKPSTLTVNGSAVTLDGGNNFSTSLLLPLGANTVTLVATDSASNYLDPSMRTSRAMLKTRRYDRTLTAWLAIWILALVPLHPTIAQIFETHYNGSSYSLGEYNLDGTPINASLADFGTPLYLAVSGSNVFISDLVGTISEYTTSGDVVNASLVTGLFLPNGIAVSGSDLFIAIPGNISGFSGSIAEYTTSGNPVNTSLITGLGAPNAIAISGSNLFVLNNFSGTIDEYTTSGILVKQDLVSGLSGNNHGLAVAGSALFVTNFNLGTISEYSTSGALVNAVLVSNLDGPYGLAASSSDLFVGNITGGTIGEYDFSGNVINASLISGLAGVSGIAVEDQAVPEPSTWLLLLGGLGSFFLFQQLRRNSLARS